MKFLIENKIVFHPGKIQPDGTFLDPEGNPYDLIPCDPRKLAKKMSKKSGSDVSEEPREIDPMDDDDDEWIDIDTFDPYEDAEEDIDFAPEEINKETETEIDLGDDPVDEKEPGDKPGDKPKDDPKKPDEPHPPVKPDGPPGEPPEGPPELPPDGPPGKKATIFNGTLKDPHTFITAEGRTIKL